jgi:hypothetical protein
VHHANLAMNTLCTQTFGKFSLGKKLPMVLEKTQHFKQYKSRFNDYLAIQRKSDDGSETLRDKSQYNINLRI